MTPPPVYRHDCVPDAGLFGTTIASLPDRECREL
jgi:hypothetical protein